MGSGTWATGIWLPLRRRRRNSPKFKLTSMANASLHVHIAESSRCFRTRCETVFEIAHSLMIFDPSRVSCLTLKPKAQNRSRLPLDLGRVGLSFDPALHVGQGMSCCLVCLCCFPKAPRAKRETTEERAKVKKERKNERHKERTTYL